MPCFGVEVFFKEVDGSLVEFFEGLELEFLPGLAESALCNDAEEGLALPDGLEKIVEFVLIGALNCLRTAVFMERACSAWPRCLR